MRQFFYESDDESFEDMEDMDDDDMDEMDIDDLNNLMEVESQIIFIPADIDPYLSFDVKKQILAMTFQLLEKSWWWKWRSPAKKTALVIETYTQLSALFAETEENEPELEIEIEEEE